MRIVAGGRVFMGRRQSSEINRPEETVPDRSRFCFVYWMELSGAVSLRPT
jgi:hypothetical protein